jgi:hypothetical protein
MPRAYPLSPLWRRRYAESERVIQQLLREAGATKVSDGLISAKADGVQMAPDNNEVLSPETYVGYQRAEISCRKPHWCRTKWRPTRQRSSWP